MSVTSYIFFFLVLLLLDLLLALSKKTWLFCTPSISRKQDIDVVCIKTATKYFFVAWYSCVNRFVTLM